MVATQLETKPLVNVQPHPLWDVEEPTPEGRVVLRLHAGLLRPILFLCQSMRISLGLKVISIAPSHQDRVEILIDLATPGRASAFLKQLAEVLGAVDGDLPRAGTTEAV